MTESAPTASKPDSSVLAGVTLDESLPTPLYHQVYLVLRERILNGTYPHDSLLPGEQELAQIFSVSRITVKRALNELASQGLVTRHRGRGTVVRFKMPTAHVSGSFDGLLENLLMLGLETDVQLLNLKEGPAPHPIAAALEIEDAAPVQHAVRLRSVEGEPFSYVVTHVPMAVASTIKAADLKATPLLALIERAGVKVASARQWITATLADPDIARALKVSVGSALLKVTRVVRDDTGRPVQHIVAFYRPDRYQYEMELDRVHAERDSDTRIWNSSEK